ncbi:MAG: ABC transporter ATP-binding protein [Candidatus Dadabacteria bacterium]|nr:MAG: ABC transporter ATP-binding protein [Candidatus Dadabacteria bacterium]
MTDSSNRFETARRLAWPYFRRYRGAYALGLLFLIGTNAAQVAVPWLLKQGVDLISALDQDPDVVARLGYVALWIALAAVAQAITRVASRWHIFRTGRDVEYEVRQRAYDHVLALDPAWYARHSRGDVISRVTNDIGNIRLLFGFGVLQLANTIAAYAAALTMMLSMSWKLTALALAPFPLLFWVLRNFGGRLHARFMGAQQSLGELSGFLQQALQGMDVVRGFGQQQGFLERFERVNEHNYQANMRLAWTRSLMAPLMIFVSGFGIFVVLAAGGWFVIHKEITIGEFVAFQGYLGMLVWPTLALGWLFNVLERGLASLGRVDELLSAEPVIRDRATAREIDLKGRLRVQIDGLTLQAEDGGTFELSHVAFEAAPGERVAVVGRTGSGKTVLLQTLLRLFDTPPGAVFLDDVDICDLKLETLRTRIGYLPQEPFLFGRTIRDAVTIGTNAYDDAQIEDALRRADIIDDVRALPEGLDTRLGERGVTLSGGQRQRLMIARLLMTSPAVALLDSPLASMDFATADRVRGELQAFACDRTVLWATHRLETMEWFDRILLLEEGRLIAMGPHEALMDQPLYRSLYERQQLMRALEQT